MNELAGLRVDHVGSLVRPEKLRESFARYDRKEISEEELRSAQDEAIRDVVSKQEQHGLPVVNDGEFRRRNFQESFSASVVGFEEPKNAALYYQREEAPIAPLRRNEQDFDAPGPAIITRRPAVERLRLARNEPLEEFTFVKSLATRPAKVTLLSPDRICQRFSWERSQSIYRDLDEFMEDVVKIERRIISDLAQTGCRYIQIDAPNYTAYVDPLSLERMRGRGEDPAKNLERAIEADNSIIEGFPGVTFGIHICRGNARTIDPMTGKLMPQWHREGAYDAIAEQLFNRLKHERFLLEYDSPRAGGFEPLRLMPKGKLVVLGLITTKESRLETIEELQRRTEEASRYLPLGQLGLSPQCGFGGLASKTLSEEEQWRKLDRMLEAAAKIWG